MACIRECNTDFEAAYMYPSKNNCDQLNVYKGSDSTQFKVFKMSVVSGSCVVVRAIN